MNCKITDHLFSCSAFSLGGIKRIFVADRDEIYSFFFSSGDTQLTTITNIQTLEEYYESIGQESEEVFDGWFEIKVEPQTFFTQTKVAGKNREQYNEILNCTLISMTPTKRDRFTELVNSRIVIVFQDKNNRWHCMGDSKLGAKVLESNHQTGSASEVNLINVVFQNSSKHSIRFVDSDYVEDEILIFSSPFSDCSCDSLIDNPLILNGNCQLIDLLTCPLT